jgi:ATP-dependent Clp protease ATP-binding subunit ClpC
MTTSLRAAGRRLAGPPPSGPRCSCELLLGLAEAPQVRDLLAELGLNLTDLAARRAPLHDQLPSEPADWRIRLTQRGAGGHDHSPLELLLAIARSADTHGYQLLEDAGLTCAELRRRIAARLRDLALAAAGPPRSPLAHRDATPPAERPSHIDERRSPREPARASQRQQRGEPATSPPKLLQPPEGAAPPSTPPRPAERLQERPHRPAPAPAPAPALAPEHPQPAPKRPALQPIDPTTLPPLHGHQGVLARLADALLRRSPRAPLLVGAHGSGRTLVAAHLARLLDRPLFHLRASAYRDGDELRADLQTIAGRRGVAILDDLDRSATDTPPEILSAITRAWADGDPPLLTLVSHETRARLEVWLPGVLATLDPIDLPPLTGDDLHAAVRLAAPAILAPHAITLAADAHLGELTRLAERFLAGLAMPGRALDLLELACARSAREARRELPRATIIDIIAERSGLARDRIEGKGEQDLLDLEVGLARRVVGHEPVLHALAQLIRRNRAGFASQRPVASVLLLGPSGVGKTELAKALSEVLFGRADALLRLDMSEYAEAHAVARIVGAPPGYIGHEHGGALTDPLLKRPHCVILLDEIEKAHRDVHQLLLQIFDEGRLTDGRGRTIDFRSALLLMTSNLGADRRDPRGAQLDEPAVLAAARAAFPVELWNRIEAPLVLHPLSRRDLAKICHRLVRASSERLQAERGIRYHLSDAACEHLLDRCGHDDALGARPLRHLLAREVEPLLADAILRGRLRAGAGVEVTLDRGQLTLAPTRRP